MQRCINVMFVYTSNWRHWQAWSVFVSLPEQLNYLSRNVRKHYSDNSPTPQPYTHTPKDSDLRSLIKTFTERIGDSQGFSVSSCGQRTPIRFRDLFYFYFIIIILLLLLHSLFLLDFIKPWVFTVRNISYLMSADVMLWSIFCGRMAFI